MCEALLMLHRNSLVHRDPRWDNIVQLGQLHRVMLIDLEKLAEADAALPEEFEGFTDWDELTLDEGKYTTRSDMRQFGKALQSVLPMGDSQEAHSFVAHLLVKELSAEAALQHCSNDKETQRLGILLPGDLHAEAVV